MCRAECVRLFLQGFVCAGLCVCEAVCMGM